MNSSQQIARALHGIGNVYFTKGELDRALEFHKRSLAIYENLGNKQGISNTLNSIGIILYYRGELNMALDAEMGFGITFIGIRDTGGVLYDFDMRHNL